MLHRLPDRWHTRSATLLNLVLAGLIAYQISDLALLWLDTGPAAGMPATPRAADTGQPATNGEVQLPPAGLFGVAAQAPSPELAASAPVTRLDLTLRGIFATGDSRHGLALIQDGAGNEKHFLVGQEVFGLATVHSIHKDRVILLHNGRYETLKLPRESLGVIIEPELAKKRGQAFAQIRRDFLSGNFMKLAQLVGADTAHDERGFIGFRLMALSDQGRQLLEEVGLADGDLVTHIDGVEIASSIETLRQTIAKVRDGQMTSVTIDRDGRTIEVSVELPELEPADSFATPEGEEAEDHTDGDAKTTGPGRTPS